MDAIAWLNQNHTRYQNLNDLYFISTGTSPTSTHAEKIKQHVHHKKLHLIYPKDPTGALCDLKLAAHIRNKPLKISYDKNQYHIQFEHKHYHLKYLSLNALEKATRYNFRIRTHKPKNASTYHEQLRKRYHP
jgi:hypothetical protein